MSGGDDLLRLASAAQLKRMDDATLAFTARLVSTVLCDERVLDHLAGGRPRPKLPDLAAVGDLLATCADRLEADR